MEFGRKRAASKVRSIERQTVGTQKYLTNEYADGNKAGELWAIALSEDGEYLASTAYDGRINVWDLGARRTKIKEFETKGSFGMCIDLVGTGQRRLSTLHTHRKLAVN